VQKSLSGYSLTIETVPKPDSNIPKASKIEMHISKFAKLQKCPGNLANPIGLQNFAGISGRFSHIIRD